MKSLLNGRNIVPGVLVFALAAALPGTSKKNPGVYTENALDAACSLTVYDRVQATCGACHNNAHFTTAGDFRMNNGANTHAGGILAQTLGVDPTAMTNADPLTALIIQKPLAFADGSTRPHGGIKLSLTHPTIQALITWVQAGAPAGDMNPPVQSPVAYYTGLGAVPVGQHLIVASIRAQRRTGFREIVDTAPGGNIHRIKFSEGTPPTIIENVNLTNLPGTDDAASPVVSLDGTKVAFSRKQPGQPWQIWEIGIDGTGLRQITSGSGDKVQPFYLPYQADGCPAPSGEGGVGFTSNRPGFRDEYEASTTLSLHLCDTNGSNLRQIDFNPSHDVHPWMHSSGVLLFTRWEHNEHQGHNFMPIFGICASDVAIGGTNLFGAYGEHNTSAAGNSLHEPSEVYYSGVPSGYMMARGSDRDDAGGSIVGFFNPKLEGTAGTAPNTNVIAQGDNDSMRDEMNVATVGYTYRYPRSLMNDLFVVSYASMTGSSVTFNAFNGSTSTVNIYGNFELHTFQVTGAAPNFTLTNEQPLLAVPGMNVDEVVPVLVKPQPPRIGKPIDLNSNTGVFTSGDIRERQADGQTTTINLAQVAAVRFIRALQFSQGDVDTGRDTDEGIATQIVGEAPISSDGSFAAEVPAEVPMQFQLIGTDGQRIVTHKPWVSVMRGETMRCVGCHANHSAAATVQTLEARQGAAHPVGTSGVQQFHFNRDIQPILTQKCVVCHDSALIGGAAGRNRALSLVGRFTPAGTTEAFQSLVGQEMGTNGYVISQNSRDSELMHWLKHETGSGAPFPTPADSVAHDQMVTDAEMLKIANWIDTGINFRVVDDHQANLLSELNMDTFLTDVWPILEANCYACHSAAGAGAGAMDLDGTNGEAPESQEELDEIRAANVAARANYMIPSASIILRKPLGQAQGGLSHVGGQIFTNTKDPQYVAIHNWIAAANPRLAAGAPPTDLVSVSNYPNPFRDTTYIVYGLTGAVAANINIQIFALNGKMIRELTGPANTSATIGWNKVEWDGKDKNGKTVGNDVYFYLIKAEFGDGTKKTFKGKCVKAN